MLLTSHDFINKIPLINMQVFSHCEQIRLFTERCLGTEKATFLYPRTGGSSFFIFSNEPVTSFHHSSHSGRPLWHSGYFFLQQAFGSQEHTRPHIGTIAFPSYDRTLAGSTTGSVWGGTGQTSIVPKNAFITFYYQLSVTRYLQHCATISWRRLKRRKGIL